MKTMTKALTLITLSLFVGSTFACSELEGEYKLTKVVKDRDPRNNCMDGLSLKLENGKLIVMDANGPLLAEISNKKESGESSYMGMVSDWNLRQRLTKCSATSSFNSESSIMLSSVVRTQNLSLSLTNSDKLKLRSLNFFGSSTLNCDYQKH
jgi:hypothetical protein